MAVTLGIDLRCLPADGSAGGGIAHAARAVATAIVQECPDTILYVPRTVAFDRTRMTIRLQDQRRASLVQALQSRPCDILFVPSGAVPLSLPVSAIPWIHDCDIFDHPEWFPQSWLQRKLTTYLFLKGIRRAPHIFTVSEYTKRAVERLVSSVRGRITVTGEGGDEILASIPDEQRVNAKRDARARLTVYGITRRFTLMLGTLEPRKNIPFICGIWSDVAKAIPDVDFVVAGQDGWKTGDIHAAINTAGSSVIRLADVSDDMRRDLLLAADLVLVPSFSEGFGLVALEAMQAGTPVLASNRGALPEVTGEAGLDPTDTSAWQKTIIDHFSGTPLPARRPTDVSWQRVARTILNQLER